MPIAPNPCYTLVSLSAWPTSRVIRPTAFQLLSRVTPHSLPFVTIAATNWDSVLHQLLLANRALTSASTVSPGNRRVFHQPGLQPLWATLLPIHHKLHIWDCFPHTTNQLWLLFLLTLPSLPLLKLMSNYSLIIWTFKVIIALFFLSANLWSLRWTSYHHFKLYRKCWKW